MASQTVKHQRVHAGERPFACPHCARGHPQAAPAAPRQPPPNPNSSSARTAVSPGMVRSSPDLLGMAGGKTTSGAASAPAPQGTPGTRPAGKEEAVSKKQADQAQGKEAELSHSYIIYF